MPVWPPNFLPGYSYPLYPQLSQTWNPPLNTQHRPMTKRDGDGHVDVLNLIQTSTPSQASQPGLFWDMFKLANNFWRYMCLLLAGLFLHPFLLSGASYVAAHPWET